MRYTCTVEFADDAKARLRTALKLMGASMVRIVEIEATAAPVKPDNQPTTPEALAVAALFGRKPDQLWSDVEISLFRAARKRGAITIESMDRMNRYYAAERAKGRDPRTGGIDRRDMPTFLRNIDGENDRANAYASRKKSSGPGWVPANVVTLPAPQTPEEIAEAERIRLEGLAAIERFKEGMK